MTEPSDPHKDLAGVLHDVSNALTVLLGWVGEARAPDATAESVAYALTIVEQRARIARDLARQAIGSAFVDEQRDLAAVVVEVTQALRVEAQRAGVRFVVSGEDVVARVAGAVDISQVLTNLAMNATAYAPRGTDIGITIQAEDDRCTVTVSDVGAGVAEARRASIFEGDTLREGGTGVGLRHSRALARAWGGDVTLEAREGPGACFRILWPRVDAVPRPPMSTARVHDLSALRVLVVEDDVAVTQLLDAALEARGAVITIAGTREGLTRALRSGPYDAVLVDLSPIADDLPGALEAIRQTCPEATLVLITGNADALPASVTVSDFRLVRKPFELTEIFDALRR